MPGRKDQSGDDRFAKIKKDPRFWEMPEKERKIKIDKRFQSMFHDERFKLKYTVDKRGRPVNHSSAEDLKRFYNLSDSEQSDVPEEKEEKKKEKKEKKTKSKPDAEQGPDVDDAEEEEDLTEKVAKKGKKGLRSADVGKADKPKGKEPTRGVKVFEEGEEEEEDDSEGDEDEDGDMDMDESVSEGSEEEEEEDDGAEEDEGDEDESDVQSEEEEEDSDSGPDLARGKGNIETSSDEDDDEEDEIEKILHHEEEEIQHDWGEMWKDAPRSDDMSQRLAVCNMDWDRIKAKDLLALLNSFKPKGGVVLSVKIYPSEFGKERMKAEETQGPLELTTLPEDPEEDTEEQRIYREKVRDYQFKRMRYYYAVVECDSPETAAKIYEECDGFEYESSCSMLDLRFIPDDVTFDDEPKEVATDVDYTTYKPKLFTSSTTTTAKVDLTWDETDHDRVTALNRKFNKDELLEMDFKAYLASSSEEDEEEEEEEEEEAVEKLAEVESEGQKKSKKPKKNDTEQIAKYRELLKGIQERDQKEKDKDMEMEITWVPGLKETTEKLVKKKLEGKDKLTPWEEYLQKKKEKKKEKRKQKKESAEADISDDELPPDVDLNDPFFAEELGQTGTSLKSKKTKNSKKSEEERTPEEEEELEKQKAEMELLMDDDEDEKHKHFNFDKIVEHQNLSKKKRKKLMKSNTPLEEDDFQVDVKDPRFQAMFTSHLYNLDPSDPAYKKTKGTQSIVEEKQRRREEQQQLEEKQRREEALKSARAEPTQDATPEAVKTSQKAMDPGLALLIKSVKNKTDQHQARKKQRTK